jgi:hypothetical protein
VPEHLGILGNEEADTLARQAYQPRRYLVLIRLLEYLNVHQEKQLRSGLSINIIVLGEICQVIYMASFL